MRRFVIERISVLNGTLAFFKLIIDNKCLFDIFWEQQEKDGNLKRELIQIQTRMEQIARGDRLPPDKHRDITPKKDTFREYEIKTKHLRVYTFHDSENGRIIILGGTKNSQKRDIPKFREMKKLYLKNKTLC